MCSSMVEQSAVNRKAVGSTPAASALDFGFVMSDFGGVSQILKFNAG